MSKNSILYSLGFIVSIFILTYFNIINYFPIYQHDFSNPDFSVTLDKINNFKSVLELNYSTLQYGPGYEFLYLIINFFKEVSVEQFYKITYLYFPVLSFSFYFISLYLKKIDFYIIIFLTLILFFNDFFIYSSIRYIPILSLSLLLLDFEKNRSFFNIILIFLFGFFFFVGIDYGIICFIAIVLTKLLLLNSIYSLKENVKLIFYLLISIIFNYFLITKQINFISEIKNLFIFSSFGDINDPTFNFNYPLPLIDSFSLTKIIENFKILIFYTFPFIQLTLILILIIHNLIKYKHLKNIDNCIIFLSAVVFASQIRILFGPGFVIYNAFQIILLLLLFLEKLNLKKIKIIYSFFIVVFAFLFLEKSLNKIENKNLLIEKESINFPIKYMGINMNEDFFLNLIELEVYLQERNIDELMVYPWSYITTLYNKEKINLILDDRHLSTYSYLVNKDMENLITKTNNSEYLLLDLNFSMGMVYFDENGNYYKKINQHYSNYKENSILFSGIPNSLRTFILENYEFKKSFDKFYIYKKISKKIEKPYKYQNINFKLNKKNNNRLIEIVNIEKNIDFLDIEIEINETNYFKKFFGQNYLVVEFYDQNNFLISTSTVTIGRNNLNKSKEYRFYINTQKEDYMIYKFLLKTQKVKNISAKINNFDIKNIRSGKIKIK